MLPSNAGTTTTRPTWLIDSLLLVALALFIVVITALYISNERQFYFWDYKGFQHRSQELTTYVRSLPNPSFDNLVTLFGAIRSSTFNDYSHYPSVLPALAALVFGDARLVFILSLMIFHMLPFAVSMGAIAARLIRLPTRPVFWSAAFVTVLLATIWKPTLRGYADIGASSLMMLAVLLYLRHLTKKSWWHIAVIGLLLALVLLFRRHFIYAVVSFLAAAFVERSITAFYEWRRYRKANKALLPLMAGSVHLSLILVATLVMLGLFGPFFVGRLLNDNFGSLYTSYEFSIAETIDSFVLQYGFVMGIAALAGFIVAAYAGLLRRSESLFIVLYTLIIIPLWVFIVRQIGMHYTLHITVSVIVGLVALGCWLWVRQKRALFIAGWIFLVFNFIVTLDPLRMFVNFNLTSNHVLSIGAQPLVDVNYAEIERLVMRLRELDVQPIFVAASSGDLNQDILIAADEVIEHNNAANQPLSILYTPDADSRDWYPLEQLLEAELVIVATPFQYHLAIDEQDVVEVVVEAFSEGWPISEDFEALPEQFHLQNGAVISLYRRIRPTAAATALTTFQTMADFIGERPQGQTDWMRLTPAPAYEMSKSADGQYQIHLTLPSESDAPAAVLLYVNPLSGKTTVEGNFTASAACGAASLHLDAISDLGNSQVLADSVMEETGDFAIEMDTPERAYLLVTVLSDTSADCRVEINGLSVAQSE